MFNAIERRLSGNETKRMADGDGTVIVVAVVVAAMIDDSGSHRDILGEVAFSFGKRPDG